MAKLGAADANKRSDAERELLQAWEELGPSSNLTETQIHIIGVSVIADWIVLEHRLRAKVSMD